MAEAGRPGIATLDAAGMRVGIVAAQWNRDLCDQMLTRAREVAEQAGATVDVARVAGSIELPVVARAPSMRWWRLALSFVVTLPILITCANLSPMG